MAPRDLYWRFQWKMFWIMHIWVFTSVESNTYELLAPSCYHWTLLRIQHYNRHREAGTSSNSKLLPTWYFKNSTAAGSSSRLCLFKATGLLVRCSSCASLNEHTTIFKRPSCGLYMSRGAFYISLSFQLADCKNECLWISGSWPSRN